MNKLNYLFLIAALLLLSSCGDSSADEPTIVVNKERLEQSKALYALHRFEHTETALMNEKGEVVIPWQSKNINKIQPNEQAFQADRALWLKRKDWELIKLDDGLGISQVFEFQGKAYFIGRKNRQSFVLDSLAQPIKLLPAFIYGMECSTNYCHYHGEGGSVFVDQDFNVVWQDKNRNIVQQHPKADHILYYEENQNYDVSYKLVNLKTGKSISTRALDIDNPLSKFRRLIRNYVDKGVDFFPMVVNSSEEFERYKKILINSSDLEETIVNDSIKIQLFNWDFEPISSKIYRGRYFTGETTKYAQYGRRWKKDYSIILFDAEPQLLDGWDYAYPIDYKNWVSVRDKQNISHVFYKGQFLNSFPQASIKVLNDQCINVIQNNLNTVYDSTGAKLISERNCKFYSVSKQNSQEQSLEFIAKKTENQINLIKLRSNEHYQIYIPKELQYYTIKYLGADVWAIDNYALIKGNKILYLEKLNAYNNSRISFDRLTASLFQVKINIHYYAEAEREFKNDDIVRIVNLEGEEIIAGDFSNQFSAQKTYTSHDLLELIPYKSEEDHYTEGGYFNQKGEQIWPKNKRSLQRAPNIQNREELARFIQENSWKVENWKGEASLTEVLEPLNLTNYQHWGFDLIHFNAEGHKQILVYNQAGDQLLEGLNLGRFDPFKSGDFLVLSAIEMSSGQTKKSIKPICFKVR